jgi:hypothetical protein
VNVGGAWNGYNLLPFTPKSVYTNAGSAWSGYNPWLKENMFCKKTIENSSLTLVLEKEAAPFVVGFGAGLRALLAGYTIRLDVAWGAADRMIAKKPMVYFSLATDF